MSGAGTPNGRPRRWRLRRIAKILAWTAGLTVAAPFIVAAALLLLLNTSLGQRLATEATGALTGATVEISGLSGTLPWDLRVARAALSDRAGTYATLSSLHLVWAPLGLLSGTLRIERLTAGAIDVARLPRSTPATRSADMASAGSFGLPIHVVLKRFSIGRLALGTPVVGTAATLSVTGHADLASLSRGMIEIHVKRLGAPGTYSIGASMTPRTIQASVRADEADRGLIAEIAHLPNLNGKLHIDLSLAGDRRAAALHIALAAGPLRMHAGGTIDLPGQTAVLELTANAPAMAPAPGLSWQSIAIDAHVAGPWPRPEARGSVAIVGLRALGSAIGRLDATVQGDRGQVFLDATANRLVIPGPKPDLLATSPLHLTATALLDARERPVTFALADRLIAAHGTVDLHPTLRGDVHLTLPDLAPLAAAAGLHVAGSTALDIGFARRGTTTTASLSGPISITGSMSPLASLIGKNGHLSLDATLYEMPSGQHIDIRSLRLDGAALRLDAHGTSTKRMIDLAYGLDLPDLAAASPALRGRLALRGTAKGPLGDLAAHVAVTGTFGTANVAAGPIDLTADGTNLLSHPHAAIVLRGMFDKAPLVLSADATRGAGGTHVVLHVFDWKSLRGTADLTLPAGAALPLGTLDLRMARLADLAPLVHQPITGSVTTHIATGVADGTPRVMLVVHAQNAGTPAARVGTMTLDGTIADPTAKPVADLRLAVRHLSVGGIAGQADVAVTGPESALAIRAGGTLARLAGAPANIETRATVDVPGHSVDLAAFTANWKGENLRLLAPATITYAPHVSVKRLRLAVGAATLDLAGRILPTLDLALHLANVTPGLAKPFAPTLEAAGVIDVAAHLTGTTAAPRGTVRVSARGMRFVAGNARAIPAANLLATLGLAGDRTSVNARLTAGSDVALAINGTAPLSTDGPLDLAVRGGINLAIANPILEADGEHVAGQVAINAAVRGSPSHPASSGTIRLSGGDVQDHTLGAHLSDISALIADKGQTVTIESFLAHAGPGTVRLSGRVGALAPGIPVDLALHMSNAQLLASDLLTANLDAEIALRGQAERRLNASGTVEVRRATVNIPASLPSSVATLNVVRPGQKQSSPRGKAPVVGLDLSVHAQPAIFVRGRGLFARLGGDLRVRGTSAAPQISRGFQMANGSFSLAGANLKFTEGRVGFDGASVTNQLNPTLHFVAQSSSGGITATLTVGGTASHPTIALSSSPSLPQDEVLAHLLYGVSITQLSPLQIAAIAQGIYSLTSGNKGSGPLGGLQNALGLDRLAVGSSNGTVGGASLRAGKYVAPGVYVGATQSVGGATRAQVQINLTKRLKLNTEVGTGGGTATGAAPQTGPSNSIGLSYQFEY